MAWSFPPWRQKMILIIYRRLILRDAATCVIRRWRNRNMLDFIGLVITAALMVLIVSTLTIVMDASRTAKITLAAVLGLWIGLPAPVAQAGWLPISGPIPVFG